jgi:HEAT repeat protein
MKLMKLGLIVACVSLIAVPSLAIEERIRALLRSMADGGAVPTDKVFYDSFDEDYVRGLSAESVREFLPLVRTVLQDSRPEARRYGLECFFAVTLRFSDGETLLEPYVPDLLRVASDRASPLRPMAMEVLGNTWPKLSPKTLAYIAAHVADKENTADDTGWMACTLFRAGMDPPIHGLIAFVRKENQHETVETVLRCFHLYPTKNADVLAFIGSSLDNSDTWIRRRAVEAVERVPLVERSPFFAQLNRLATDPNQPTEIRSAAAEALKK